MKDIQMLALLSVVLLRLAVETRTCVIFYDHTTEALINFVSTSYPVSSSPTQCQPGLLLL